MLYPDSILSLHILSLGRCRSDDGKGGWKGGIQCFPATTSARTLSKVTERCVKEKSGVPAWGFLSVDTTFRTAEQSRTTHYSKRPSPTCSPRDLGPQVTFKYCTFQGSGGTTGRRRTSWVDAGRTRAPECPRGFPVPCPWRGISDPRLCLLGRVPAPPLFPACFNTCARGVGRVASRRPSSSTIGLWDRSNSAVQAAQAVLSVRGTLRGTVCVSPHSPGWRFSAITDTR